MYLYLYLLFITCLQIKGLPLYITRFKDISLLIWNRSTLQ